MLSIMRKQKESLIIRIVFVVIVLSFIGTIFLVWGKGSDGIGGGSKGYAAKVNGTAITLEEYQNAYERKRNTYSQIFGQSITPELEKTLGLKKSTLDEMVDIMLAIKESRSLGIKVSKDEVASSIESIKDFQQNGRFNEALYHQQLKRIRITANDFEEGHQGDLLLAKVRKSIADKAVVTDADALAQYKKENDKLELEFVSFTPAEVAGEVKLTEAELNDFLQKNPAAFKTAEKVSFSYLKLDPAAYAAKTSVTDEEIQTFYQKNIDRWQKKDGIQPLAEVKERVKAEAIRHKAAKQVFELAADTLYKNIKAGDLNLVAKELGLKVHEAPLFPANDPPAVLAGESAVIKKAVELKPGELGGPVETTKGIYIIKVKERKESVIPPLADVKTAVTEKARSARAVELARQKGEEAAKQLAAKGSLKTQVSGSFSYLAKGEIPKIGTSPEMMEDVFKLTAGQAPPSPYKIGDRWYAVRVKSRIEADGARFETIKEGLKKRMLPLKQEEALAQWYKGLREKAKIEINQALISDK